MTINLKHLYSNVADIKHFTDGNKMEYCKKCHGTGHIPCDACKGGLMEVPCPECDGDGWFTESGVDKTSSCTNCHGEGDLDPENCSVCHGEKVINCPDCDGTGEVPVKE